MGQRGRRALTDREVREVADLYRWGMRVKTICELYGIGKDTLKGNVRYLGVPIRTSGARSNPSKILAGAADNSDAGPDIDQLVRSRALLPPDIHTAPRRVGVSIRSYPEAVYEPLFEFWRTYNHRLNRG